MDVSTLRIAFQFVDEARLTANRLLVRLEAWQIISYTIAVVFVVQWVRKVLKSDKPVVGRLRAFKKIEVEKAKARKFLEEQMMKYDKRREFYRFLPEHGVFPEDIYHEACEYEAMGEFKFSEGKVSGAVYAEDDENFSELIAKVFSRFAIANPIHPDIFPGVRKMEAEVVRMLCSMYHGGLSSCGTVTAGGSESIILACLAYRNRAFEKGIRKPEMVVATTAHAAFDKAAHLLQIRIIHVPVDQNHRADVGAMKRAIGNDTCMIVASAPNFISGTVDPIENIAKLGERYDVPVHVDLCLGGFLLPFMEQCDFNVPPFDFRLSGVTSISVDMHKYGYCPKGSSAVLYRNSDYMHRQFFCNSEWMGGIYATPTLAGSRSGSAIAVTWATLLYHGRHGYVERTQRILDAARMIREGIAAISSLTLLGDPSVSVIAFTGNHGLNIHSLADKMLEKGWSLTALQKPAA
uniref:sphinganine-1-phosphate aldolase n=1 Tax=Steinernema glaseri TaxID=37863 RepID=A0A1I7Y1G3_9BILA